MKKLALLIALCLMFSATCLSQTHAWRTEHHDFFLVAPTAKDVKYTATTVVGAAGPREEEELTYTVEEPYPASKFIDHLQKDLQLKGWRPDTDSGVNLGVWEKPPLDRSRPYECLWIMPWKSSRHESVSYWLQYRSAKDQHLRILHVHAYFTPVSLPPERSPSVDAKPGPSSVYDRILRLGLLLLYFIVLIATIWTLAFTRVRAAVFYGGPTAWLTWVNLFFFFAPVILSFLAIGGIVIASVGPAIKDVPAMGAAALGIVGIWLLILLFSKAGYVAVPIVLLVTARILFSEDIPRNVKIAHAVLGLLSLGFFVACIAGASRQLIRW